jgi:hypothetical protein
MPPDAPESAPGDAPAPRKPVGAELAAYALAALLGALIAALPHLVAFVRTGDATWIADNDDLELYLPVGAEALRHGPFRLTDPVGGGPSLYPWLQLGPAVVVARALGLSPAALGLLWRLQAGVTIGLAWTFVLRRFTRTPWGALGAASLLLTDCGLLFGRPIVRQIGVAARVALGRTDDLLATLPQIHTEWRILSPGLSLAWLLLFLGLLDRAREAPTRKTIALAGISFGLLFYVFFYSWTAAALALALALAIDAEKRRVHAHTAWIGGLVGLPALVSGMRSPTEWLLRSDLFLPIPRTSELLFPKVALGMAALAGFWVLRRRRELLPAWTLAAAGLALVNHQLVTGLQIQNFHWSYVWGPLLSLTLVEIVLVEVCPRATPRGRVALVAALAALVLVGLWLRVVEATRTKQPQEIAAEYARQPAVQLEPRAVIAGERAFVDFAVALADARPLDGYLVQLSSSVDDAEWDARAALGGVLRGLDAAAFEAEERKLLGETIWGPCARDPEARARKIETRVRLFRELAADIESACARFSVRYVALRADRPAPAFAAGWTRLDAGPAFQLWERRAR